MKISYEKMTEEDYLKRALFQKKTESRSNLCSFFIDKAKINSSSDVVHKICFPDNIKNINVDFIQIKSEFFYENLCHLYRLLIFLGKKSVNHVNIKIYSYNYAYLCKEIDASIYCDSNDEFGKDNCNINFKKVLLIIFLNKALGLRCFKIFYKIYHLFKKPFG